MAESSHGGWVKDRTVELLPKPLLDKIAAVATVRAFPKRAIIVTEGDDSDSLYVMISGKARVFVADDKGREVQLNQLGVGEYFGEVTLDGGPRSASVMAVEDCRCAVVKRAELTAFIEKNPELAIHIVRKLARRVRDLTENVRSLALMDVYGRVARLLLDLAEQKDGRMVVSEPLTHKDIASRVGASREMISRIFSDLADGGYVRKEDGLLVIARKPPPRW
jgi:CRP/FNR family transcriptional regulator, cyclic AMP receptor protein